MNYKDYQDARDAAWKILLDCGVTEEQLESLKEIYLTDIPQYNIVYETTAVEQGQ